MTLKHPFAAQVVGVVLVVAPLVYADMRCGIAADAGDRGDVTSLLFQKQPMDKSSRLRTFWFVPYKLVVTCLSVCLPLPCGVFKPSFVAGAAIGRAVGELLHSLCYALLGHAQADVSQVLAWEYAVIGASARRQGGTFLPSFLPSFLQG